ncbi:MAG: alkaline phosphatase [Bacteroidota bacterium]
MKKTISAAIILVIGFSLAVSAQDKKPKNLIIMIGDGMGLNQVNSVILSNKDNAFSRFHSLGLSVTCSADNLITDSAAGATALSTGERTNNHYLGVTPEGKPLQNIMELAQKKGKATGVVVTCSITHATPAGFVAHIDDRAKEYDIAKQFTESDINVAIGGGTDFFLPKKQKGKREDGENLAEKLAGRGYKVVYTLDELKNNSSEKVYALLEPSSLPTADKRDYSLADLVKAALTQLSKDEDGFVLMVEGSQIDWGGHANDQKLVQNELNDFNKAINLCLDFAKEDMNTTVVVTADHETGGMGIVDGDREAKDLKFGFLTKGHTVGAVGVFASGPGEEIFRGVFNNREIGKNFFKLVE